MATVRQYFETDFNHVVQVHLRLAMPNDNDIECGLLVDFLGYMSFLTCRPRAFSPAYGAGW